MPRRSDGGRWSLVALGLGAVLLPGRTASCQEALTAIATPPGLGRGAAYAMAFSRGGDVLALPQDDGRVNLLDVASGKVVTIPAPGGRPWAAQVAFSKSGRSLAVMNPGRGVAIWDVATGKPGAAMPMEGEARFALGLAFLDDDRTLRAVTARPVGPGARAEFAVFRWDVATGERRGVEDFGRQPQALAVSSEGRYGVVPKDVVALALRDFRAGRDVCDLGRGDQGVIFAADGATLVTCDRGRIALRDAATGRERRSAAVEPALRPAGQRSDAAVALGRHAAAGRRRLPAGRRRGPDPAGHGEGAGRRQLRRGLLGCPDRPRRPDPGDGHPLGPHGRPAGPRRPEAVEGPGLLVSGDRKGSGPGKGTGARKGDGSLCGPGLHLRSAPPIASAKAPWRTMERNRAAGDPLP